MLRDEMDNLIRTHPQPVEFWMSLKTFSRLVVEPAPRRKALTTDFETGVTQYRGIPIKIDNSLVDGVIDLVGYFKAGEVR